MDWLFVSITEGMLYKWEQVLSEWIFAFSILLLAVELARYYFHRKLAWVVLGDTATNFVTQALFLAVSFLLIPLYLSTLSIASEFALFDISNNWTALLVCIVLADLMYYWEHRFSHRVAMVWATHTVHHSSPYFNMSVAYRFGPMDALWSVLFNVPLVLLGFSPFLVLFAAAFVLVYQTILHTEMIGKLPRPIEFLFNTPSHHRVHHGTKGDYIDKNFAGMFIIWDRMFGTFAEEKAPVAFGIGEPINSVNPFLVFFHGFTRLWRDLGSTKGIANKLLLLVKPPGWQPGSRVSTATPKPTPELSK